MQTKRLFDGALLWVKTRYLKDPMGKGNINPNPRCFVGFFLFDQPLRSVGLVFSDGSKVKLKRLQKNRRSDGVGGSSGLKRYIGSDNLLFSHPKTTCGTLGSF